MFYFHFSSEEKTARLLRITVSLVVNFLSYYVTCVYLIPFVYTDVKLLIFPDISIEMDLNDVVPAPRVQKTVDCTKNSKSSKTVRFHTIKRNPYLDMDTGADTVGQSGSRDESGTVKTSVEVGGSKQIQKLRQKLPKIPSFKTPLKRKCHVSDCIQCNMKKCYNCTACKNPQWKKGCQNKEPCPYLNPTSSLYKPPAENDLITSLLDKTIYPEDTDDNNDTSNKSGNDNTPGKTVTQNNTANITIAEIAEYSLQSVISVQDLDVNSGQTANENDELDEYQPNVSDNIGKAAMSENREDITEKQTENKESASSKHKQVCAEVKWQCDKCYRIFSYATRFNNHKCDDSKMKIPCASCNKPVSKKFMPIHIKMHSNLRLDCSKCKRKFTSEEKLNQHMAIHKTKVLRCHVCGDGFPSKSILIKHVENSHQYASTADLKTENKCKFCDAVFSNLALFRNHLKTAHVEMASLKCGSCPKVYFSSRGLRNHRKKAHKDLPATEISEINLNEENPRVVLPFETDNFVIDLAKDIDLEELAGSDVTFV